MLIDTHAHLCVRDYDADREEVLSRSFENGLAALIEVGSVDSFYGNARALAFADAHPEVYACVGLHPHDAKDYTDDAWAELCRQARHPKVVAIGETGFDFHYHLSTRAEQERAFAASIALALDLHKPLVIHDREAHAECEALLLREGGFKAPGVFHCFTGDWAFAETLLGHGWYVALGGMVTFAKATDAHEVARRVPLDRLLLETDCPYMTPVPRRGKRNEPWLCKLVAERIALLRECSPEAIISATGENACRLFPGFTPA